MFKHGNMGQGIYVDPQLQRGQAPGRYGPEGDAGAWPYADRDGCSYRGVWRDILNPVIARYAGCNLGGRFLRADAAYAIPAIYERLEEAGYFYAVRLPANAVLKEKIALRLTRPVGRPSMTKVNRFFVDFEYPAACWDKERRVIAKIEWHPG